jgi:hypothetical protein
MESVYNKTFTPLNAGNLWKGRSEIVDVYNIANVSCASDTNGLLSLLQSQNDINYDFANLYDIVGGTPFNISEKLKAKYFRVVFENTSVTNQSYLRISTVYKNAVQDNLLTSIPALEACIVDNQVACSIENFTVDISGQSVYSNIRDACGNPIYSVAGKLLCDISGQTLNVNTISGFALDTTLGSTNTKLDTLNTTVTNKHLNKTTDSVDISGQSIVITSIPAITTDINGQTVNSNTYASSNGSNWHRIKSDNQGELLVHSMVQSGAGDNITSTVNSGKSCLDVHVGNASVPVTGTFWQATQPVSGTFWQATQPVSGSVSVSNLPVTQPVSGTFWQATQPVSGSVSVSNFPATQTVDGTVNSNVKSSFGDSIGATAASLHTYDYNVNLAFDTTGEVIKTLGMAKDGTNYRNFVCDSNGYLNTNIQNGSTTNSYSTSGINVYPIVPKAKYYVMGGYDANATANGLVSGNSTAGIPITTYNFGVANARTYYAVLTIASTRTLYYDYVDASGNLVENASVSINNATATSLGSMISIVDFRLGTAISATNEFLHIGLSTTVATLKATSLCYEDINQKLNSVFTIPNGYIGYFSSLTSLTNTASGLQMNKWDSTGIRSSIWRVNNPGNIYINSGSNGVLGEMLKPGESVAFSLQSAVAGKSTVANLTLVATN